MDEVFLNCIIETFVDGLQDGQLPENSIHELAYDLVKALQ